MTRSSASKHLALAFRCGRLGNRLTIFANFIAYAEEHGYRVSNVTFHTYAHLFEATRRDIYCRYPVPDRRSLFDLVPGAAAAIRKTRVFFHATRVASLMNERYGLFGPRVKTLREFRDRRVTLLEEPAIRETIEAATTVFVYGWNFRTPDLMRKHAAKIRAYFRPIEEYETASRRSVENLRQQADILVGVHVRRGDNWKWKGGKYFFPASRYGPWMHEVAEQFPGRKVAFLVCSDEPRSVDEFPGVRVGLAPGSLVGDLYALAGCDYIFGPPSTFTQWASFYGNAPMMHLKDNDCRLEIPQFQVSYLEKVPPD